MKQNQLSLKYIRAIDIKNISYRNNQTLIQRYIYVILNIEKTTQFVYKRIICLHNIIWFEIFWRVYS